MSADWGGWGDWAEWGLDFLSGAAVLFLVWITFPAWSGSSPASSGAGRRPDRGQLDYPGSRWREQGVWEAVRPALNFALVSIGLNLLALPIYFLLPVINLLVFLP